MKTEMKDCTPQEEAQEIHSEIKEDMNKAKKQGFFSRFGNRLKTAAKTASCAVCGAKTLSKTGFCQKCRKEHPNLVHFSEYAVNKIRKL